MTRGRKSEINECSDVIKNQPAGEWDVVYGQYFLHVTVLFDYFLPVVRQVGGSAGPWWPTRGEGVCNSRHWHLLPRHRQSTTHTACYWHQPRDTSGLVDNSMIICPIAIAYSMGQIIKSFCVCPCVCACVCVSVCGHSPSRISSSIFTKLDTDV